MKSFRTKVAWVLPPAPPPKLANVLVALGKYVGVGGCPASTAMAPGTPPPDDEAGESSPDGPSSSSSTAESVGLASRSRSRSRSRSVAGRTVPYRG